MQWFCSFLLQRNQHAGIVIEVELTVSEIEQGVVDLSLCFLLLQGMAEQGEQIGRHLEVLINVLNPKASVY